MQVTHKHTYTRLPLLTTEAATESVFSRFYFYICKKQGCFCFCFPTIIVKCLQESSSVFSAERVFEVQHGTQMFFPVPKEGRSVKESRKKACFLSPGISGPDQLLEAAQTVFWYPLYYLYLYYLFSPQIELLFGYLKGFRIFVLHSTALLSRATA